jgi:2-aminoadipate transaminase
MSTSRALEQRLREVDREAEQSLVDQLVAVFTEAIASGEVAPGARLPPTRRIAELAAVNQLTAGRCYRRLQAARLVVSEVGRGTFVRAGAAVAERSGNGAEGSWQAYSLPAERGGESSWLMSELAHHVNDANTIPLSVGHPPDELIPLEQLQAATVAAVERHGTRSFAYGPVEGVSELREELARLGRANGLDDDSNAILVTTGARQGVTLATRALLRPGDKVACESPTYMGIIDALTAVDAQVLPLPLDERGLDTGALEELLSRHEIRMLVLQPRLHNPTGCDLAPERRLRLVELARQHRFFILEDAVYAGLRFEGEDPGPLRALAPAHVIYVDSFSKTIGGGLRAGWIAATGPVYDRLVAEKRSDDTHGPTLAQQTVAAYLAGGHYEGQLLATRRLHRERRDLLLDALDHELAELASFTRPAGGGHVWLTLNDPCNEGRLYRSALAAGVAFVPGSAMLVDRPRATHLRLSFGSLPPEIAREGVRRLAGVIRDLHDTPPERRSLAVN